MHLRFKSLPYLRIGILTILTNVKCGHAITKTMVYNSFTFKDTHWSPTASLSVLRLSPDMAEQYELKISYNEYAVYFSFKDSIFTICREEQNKHGLARWLTVIKSFKELQECLDILYALMVSIGIQQDQLEVMARKGDVSLPVFRPSGYHLNTRWLTRR